MEGGKGKDMLLATLFLIWLGWVTTPSQGATLTVCASGCTYNLSQLQNAVDAATCGDIIEVDKGSTVNMGATSLILKNKPTCNTNKGPYITIRSTGVTELLGGVRVTPADSTRLFKLTITAGAPATITNEVGAGFYRFHGVEITAHAAFVGDLVEFGLRSPVFTYVADNQISDLAHDIVFEQCYFHGDSASTDGPRRGIRANMANMVVIDSWFENLKNQNGESNAIGGWNSYGPYYFRNNHFEAVAITTLFGGAQPNIRGIRANGSWFIANYYTRPWKYRVRYQTVPPTNPCLYDADGFGEYYEDQTAGLYYRCVGGTFQTISAGQFSPYYWQKNVFELKNAWRIWVEGNYMENAWNPATQNQFGAMFLFNLVDNDPPSQTFEAAATVGYVNVTNNYGQKTVWVSSLGGVGGPYWLPHNNINFDNNVFNQIGDSSWTLSAPELFGSKFGGNMVVYPGNDTNIAYTQNTFISRNPIAARAMYMFGSTANNNRSIRSVYANNISPWNLSGYYNDMGSGNLWGSVDDSLAPGYSFHRNLIVDNQSQSRFGRPSSITNTALNLDTPSAPMPCIGSGAEMSTVPATTYNGKCGYPASYTTGIFADYANENYTVTGPYVNWGSMGATPGANINQVNWSTQGVNTSAAVVPKYIDFVVKQTIPASTSLRFIYNAYNTAVCTVAVSRKFDMSSPTTVSDTGGDVYRDVTVSGLVSNTRYWYQITCNSTNRTGIALTR